MIVRLIGTGLAMAILASPVMADDTQILSTTVSICHDESLSLNQVNDHVVSAGWEATHSEAVEQALSVHNYMTYAESGNDGVAMIDWSRMAASDFVSSGAISHFFRHANISAVLAIGQVEPLGEFCVLVGNMSTEATPEALGLNDFDTQDTEDNPVVMRFSYPSTEGGYTKSNPITVNLLIKNNKIEEQEGFGAFNMSMQILRRS